MASISANGSRGHHRFTLNVNETGTNTSNNTSTVSFSFQLSDQPYKMVGTGILKLTQYLIE